MSSTYYPIVMEKGADFTLSVVWNDNNGNPINLTGYNAKMAIFQDPNYYVYVVKASTLSDGMANTSITLGGTAGSIVVSIQVPAVALLRDGQATVYGLSVLSPGGVYTRLFEGPVTLKPLSLEW